MNTNKKRGHNKEFCIENKYVNRKLKNGGWKFRATSAHSIYKYTYFYSITNFLFYRFRSHYVKINEKCKKGEIRWTLTKKYLNLSFQVSGKKELCFSSRAPNGLQKYSVFKRYGKKMKKIGTPMRGRFFVWFFIR